MTTPRNPAGPASWPTRILRGISAVLASFLAFLVLAIVLGAYFPAIPKAGVIGPVLGGQYPFHIALIALVAAVLAALAWRGGLVRWGRTVTVLTTLCAVGALAIGGIQFRAAQNAGTDISFGEAFSELGYPAAKPDATKTYASPEGKPLQVDAYLPANTPGQKAPAVVLAHAGGFHTFDKSDLRGTGRWLADHGVAVFAVDYRLAAPDRPTWDKAPQDLVSALSWVQKNADAYGIDSSRISLGGMSAGGTLAMNTAYRLHNGTIKAADGATPQAPASVIGFYPGTDVTQMWKDDVAGTREAAEMYTGGTPKQYPDRYREVSPTSDIHAGLPRTLLVVGDRDRSARPETVTAFGDALKKKGVLTEVKELPFAEHAFDDAYGSLTSQTSRQILLHFLTEDKH
ncbi:MULTISPECIES: alpha/beta hydrolase [Streptomyces]|uniref:Hydrolase n=1 Tax=Streptomyces griseus subsp. griseus (strain JCM 4626 / CBS 651.72 / NBRC 13350 / KCC S-0626 / ISP 5235) TaxID=455632 RepID=B1VPS6_STRGG|nr:alpha/beta hydrolase [Streptomyces griseus]MYR14228.1 alpha/beta hydrolase fold domain-containing protein [Streptomyces sp. SID724]BAG23826.1 putative hydrolase [Streptomyces griseus subsp. griseus NBRC 13350]SEE22947.1 Acetyl esterase/lipase [Streptomyces griseus]SQA21838.1 hydrolase [Streptomyces griseus]